METLLQCRGLRDGRRVRRAHYSNIPQDIRLHRRASVLSPPGERQPRAALQRRHLLRGLCNRLCVPCKAWQKWTGRTATITFFRGKKNQEVFDTSWVAL